MTRFRLSRCLRRRLGFDGLVFSDDFEMAGVEALSGLIG